LPVGCFLLRTTQETVLVDTGVGQLADATVRELAQEGYRFTGGDLPQAVAAAGVRPEEVGAVLLTHLHIDHCGGLLDPSGADAFLNARLWIGRADWEWFVVKRQGSMTERIRASLEKRQSLGRVELMEGDRVIAPGVTARATPGHTPGHYSVVVADGDERALILGDAVTWPAQLEEPEWHAPSDMDPDLAARTRESLFRELEREGGIAVGGHFPGIEFGRVVRGSAGRTWESVVEEPR
jgi:glyoxylase-like metal-dependent hydrolase (beta-lactamase superfamily II)